VTPQAVPPPLQTVFIIDDDAAFLTAISRLLRASGLNVLTFTSPGKFLAQHSPHERGCVLTDLRMPGLDGFDLQGALARSHNPLPVVFLSGQGDIPATVRAMRSGAEDFLTKTAPKQELLATIQRAFARDIQEQRQRAKLGELQTLFTALTDREREVLAHVVRGRLNKQIATDLGIHERTVKLHRTAITTKLRVHSVAELTRMAHELGIE
jgi:FixJ family two-component response regulator